MIQTYLINLVEMLLRLYLMKVMYVISSQQWLQRILVLYRKRCVVLIFIVNVHVHVHVFVVIVIVLFVL